MGENSPPNLVIRSEFPTVSWYEPKRHHRIDARAEGGTQHYRAPRDEALALANQIAADYESKGNAAFSDPSLHEELHNTGLEMKSVVTALWGGGWWDAGSSSRKAGGLGL